MKKKLIALSVASVVAGHAAAVDLTDSPPTGTVTLGTELVNTDSIAVTSAQTVTSFAGFSIANGTSKYVRYDFGNFAIGTPLTGGSLSISAGTGASNNTVSNGGLVGNDFVIFEVGATSDIEQTAEFTLTIPKVFLQDNTTSNVTYRIFETANDALNETNVLASASGAQFAFKQLLSFKSVAAAAAPDQINVTEDSTEFTGTNQANVLRNPVAAYTIAMATDVDLVNTAGALVGTPVGYGTLVNTSKATVAVSGDFSPVQDLTAGVPDGTFTVGNISEEANAGACAGGGTAPATLTAAAATLGAPAAGTFKVCELVNGVTVIPEQTFSVTFTPVSQTPTLYTVSPTTVSGETHSKNGDDVDLDIVLTPTNVEPPAAYANVVRITNKTSISGDVFMTVYNDSGDSVNLNLSDIEGQTTDNLGPQASTNLINVNAIFAAAQVADPTFELTGQSRKLRLIISGEFADIEAQNITVSTDATTFATF